MSRDIEFRAWTGTRMRGIDKNDFFSIRSDGSLSIQIPDVDFEIKLMQFTGARDRDDTKVFEDDIINGESKSFGMVLGVVCMSEYDDNEGYLHERHLGWNVNGIPLIDLIDDGLLVIGNIHEKNWVS